MASAYPHVENKKEVFSLVAILLSVALSTCYCPSLVLPYLVTTNHFFAPNLGAKNVCVRQFFLL